MLRVRIDRGVYVWPRTVTAGVSAGPLCANAPSLPNTTAHAITLGMIFLAHRVMLEEMLVMDSHPIRRA
jgi:hypothetical protein